MPSNCDHYERRSGYETVVDEWTGEEREEWVEHNKCLQEDISLHAFKCTRCGEVGYYSGAGRLVHEKGISLDAVFKELENAR